MKESPQDFGKYRLLKRIATGGMAEIFLARVRSGEGPLLVIKRMLPGLDEDPRYVSMFLDEARIASKLEHPNVVQVLDVGQIDGAYFSAMPYIEGKDLRRTRNQLKRLGRQMPIPIAVRVVSEAALGLGYAHKLLDPLTATPLGVVHRDVSPQNIMVGFDGQVRLLDFGVAKAEGKVGRTQTGVLKGKYSYMAPEQALDGHVDARSDLFALGIVLYEACTETRLFKGEGELATLQAVMSCQVPSPRQLRPEIPDDLEALILKSLSPKPEDRFQDAGAFSAALEDHLERSQIRLDAAAVGTWMREIFETAQPYQGAPKAKPTTEPRLKPEDLAEASSEASTTEILEAYPRPAAAQTEPTRHDVKASLAADEAEASINADRGQALRGQAERGPPRRPLGLLGLGIGLVLGFLPGFLLGGWLSPWAGSPQAGQSSQLWVLTEPNARLQVDGEAVATADAEGQLGPIAIRPGAHALSLDEPKSGFQRERPIEVQGGRDLVLEIKAQWGWLDLRVSPWAEVLIDGTKIGLTPLSPIKMMAKTHTLQLKNPDLSVSREMTFDLRPGETRSLEIVLQRNPE